MPLGQALPVRVGLPLPVGVGSPDSSASLATLRVGAGDGVTVAVGAPLLENVGVPVAEKLPEPRGLTLSVPRAPLPLGDALAVGHTVMEALALGVALADPVTDVVAVRAAEALAATEVVRAVDALPPAAGLPLDEPLAVAHA